MPLFRDRADAGRRLGQELIARLPRLRTEHPIVLAIPRGGVAVGREVARVLDAPLDVLIARKLGAPGREELGIGAVAPGGTRVLDEEIIRALRVPARYIEAVTQRELAELERRMRAFRGSRPPPALGARAVVLVDDGLATGVTARAALAALRREGPSLLVFGAPVCSPDGRDLLAGAADAVVCVAAPARFRGVGEWYARFDQLTDDEVIAILEEG